MTTPTVEVLLAERHRDQFGRIQQNTVRAALRAWNQLGDWSSPAAFAAWFAVWLPISDAAAAATAESTNAYFALVADVDPLESLEVSAAGLRGVPVVEYARRPFATLYTNLAKGMLWADAFQAASSRLEAMTATDVSLAQRRVAQDWAESGRVVGYRRTLTGASCALCATASTQRYHRGNLMPIHGRCDCGVAPIRGDADPGQVINQRLLDDLRRVSNRSDYWQDRDVKVDDGRVVQGGEPFEPKVRQHGELGPVLVAPDDKFTGPSITN